MAKGGMTSDLKKMGLAAMALVSLAILSVLGIVILEQLKVSIPAVDNGTTRDTLVNATVDAFIAGLALFGTFATILALIVVVKAIVGVVKKV